MAGSSRRDAGFEKGHRKLHATDVPIFKYLFILTLLKTGKITERKLYAISSMIDLFLSKKENLDTIAPNMSSSLSRGFPWMMRQ
jgi:hypothetical protein